MQVHHDHRRRHAILTLLAATALAGSCLFTSHNTEEVHSGRRQLKKAKAPKAPKVGSFADPKTVAPKADPRAVAAAAGGPNVIYIQHESLSGGIALNTEEGVKAMPFFQDMAANDANLYVFEKARTVSGIAMDAMPALMTGCLPYTKAALKWVHKPGRSVGFDFKQLGYRTASFCSRTLDNNIQKGLWSPLYDMLVGSMDTVVDPRSQKWRLDNKVGSDDRRMLPAFEAWLAELAQDAEDGKKDGGRPFYAQFYNTNQHYPYMRKGDMPNSTERYYQSLATTDEFLQRLFAILGRTGQLQNTIVVGSGDYGEEPFKDSKFARLQALNSNILQPLSYVYYPQHLLPDEGAAARLRSNTQQLMHTLDLYPTLRGVIARAVAPMGEAGGEPYVPPNAPHAGCIAGVDLATTDVPADRVVLSWNLFSAANAPKGKLRQLWALSTKDRTLYHRTHAKKEPQLQQGKKDAYVLQYDECLRDTAPGNLCQAALDAKSKEYFRAAIDWIKTTPMYDEGVKKSKLVEFFGKMVDYKEATKH